MAESSVVATLLSRQDQHSLDELVDIFRRGKPVLGLCGAGVSVPIGYPTWQGLIELLIDRLEATNYDVPPDIRATVNAQQAHLPNAASYVKTQMDPGTYYNFLKEVFSPRATVDFSHELECLARVPVRLWMTTNYDNCLSQALSEQLGQNVAVLNRVPFDNLLDSPSTLPQVVHLHGNANEPEAIVLTSEDYQEFYSHPSRLLRTFESLVPLTLFFVGYSLSDVELTNCLATTKRIFGASTGWHYALLPKSGSDSDESLQQRAVGLREMGVQPIFYTASPNDHTLRESIIEQILEDLQTSPPPKRDVIGLTWNDPNASIAHLRRELNKLGERTALRSNLILRSCSHGSQSLSVALTRASDYSSFHQAVETSDFWQLAKDAILVPATAHAQRPIRPMAGRSGGAYWPRLKESGEGTAVDRSDIVAETANENAKLLLTSQPQEVSRAIEHSKALGQAAPDGVDSFHVVTPLMPEELPFHLADCFNPVIDWRLNSPLMHVWIYKASSNNETASETIYSILIVGTGIPEIRQKVETAATSVAIALLDNGSSAILTRGVIHLSFVNATPSPHPRSSILGSILSIFGGSKGHSVELPNIPADAREAMATFKSVLVELAHDTGFLRIHEYAFSELSSVESELRTRLIRAETSPQLLPPQPDKKVVMAFPVAGLPYLDNPKIQLQLSADLLQTPELQELLDAYYRDVVMRAIADIERRIEFYTHELEHDVERVRWFRSLSPEEQAKQPDVITNRRILDDLGIDVEITASRVPAKNYYLEYVPNHHIPHEKKELERLAAMREPLVHLREQRYSPLWRKCLSRIFDCALRAQKLCDDEELNRLFERWRTLVHSMLCLEWRRCLNHAGVAERDVFRRTTFFDLEFDEHENVISIYPIAVIDPSRSALIIDPARRVLVVHDVLDGASSEAIDATNAMATGSDLRASFFAKPHLAGRVCDAAVRHLSSASELGRLRPAVRRLSESASAGMRFFRLIDQYAYNSALEALQPEDEEDEPPTKQLAIAFLNCLKLGFAPLDTLRQILANPKFVAPPEIKRPLQSALLRDRAVVEQFLSRGAYGPDHLNLTAAEEKALTIERFVEATKLAECFRRAGAAIDSRGETLNTVLLKTEQAFEEAHSAQFSSGTPSLIRIQRFMTGEPLPPTLDMESSK
jgi:hypothetical protein